MASWNAFCRDPFGRTVLCHPGGNSRVTPRNAEPRLANGK